MLLKMRMRVQTVVMRMSEEIGSCEDYEGEDNEGRNHREGGADSKDKNLRKL